MEIIPITRRDAINVLIACIDLEELMKLKRVYTYIKISVYIHTHQYACVLIMIREAYVGRPDE